MFQLLHTKCYGGMTHPLPPWTNVPFDTGTLLCSNCHFQVKCFGTVLILRWTNLLERIQKLYKLPICHKIDIDHLTLFLHLFSIKTCCIYFNSGLVHQAENYLCFDCCIPSFMVGWPIPCRPGQMSHLTQEHCYAAIVIFKWNVLVLY